MTVKTVTRALPKTYFELVKKFPLTRISDDTHLQEAQEVLDKLLQMDLDEGGEAYLDVLTDLIESAEERLVNMPDASEADLLRVLMQANGLSQAKLAESTGIAQSTISAILSGKRSPTKDQVVKLAKVFGVSPTAFLRA